MFGFGCLFFSFLFFLFTIIHVHHSIFNRLRTDTRMSCGSWRSPGGHQAEQLERQVYGIVFSNFRQAFDHEISSSVGRTQTSCSWYNFFPGFQRENWSHFLNFSVPSKAKSTLARFFGRDNGLEVFSHRGLVGEIMETSVILKQNAIRWQSGDLSAPAVGDLHTWLTQG